MNREQREKLMRLHRAAMKAQFNFDAGDVSVKFLDAAEGEFRNFLLSLDVNA